MTPIQMGIEEAARKGEARLRSAYQSWWGLAESEPLAKFHAVLVELRLAEKALPEERVRAILKEAAVAWYQRTGRCALCGSPTVHALGEEQAA